MRKRQFLRSLAMAPLAGAREPAVSIDGGRQVFFDDHLVAESTLERIWHQPKIHPSSPVLQPETPLEMNEGRCPEAGPFSDGVFYDPLDQLFKMWHHAGWFDGIGYATSQDGLRWTRAALDVEGGANRVRPARRGEWRDGVTVWLDQEAADPAHRFKKFAYFRRRPPGEHGGEVCTSAAGIHRGEPHRTGPCGDHTCFYYDPFRKLWVHSIRTSNPKQGRTRGRREHPDSLAGAAWGKDDIISPWLAADELDLPDPELGCRGRRAGFHRPARHRRRGPQRV